MPFAKHVDGNGGVKFKQIPSSDITEEFIIEWADGRQVAFGTGTTDTDQTYIRLRNEAGVDSFIDVTGTTVAASATRP